jgi:hypothetical protein
LHEGESSLRCGECELHFDEPAVRLHESKLRFAEYEVSAGADNRPSERFDLRRGPRDVVGGVAK